MTLNIYYITSYLNLCALTLYIEGELTADYHRLRWQSTRLFLNSLRTPTPKRITSVTILFAGPRSAKVTHVSMWLPLSQDNLGIMCVPPATPKWSMGELIVDASPQGLIGVGGFKTAHTGWLMLMAPPKIDPGSVAHDKIVVKQPYHKVFATPTTTTGPYKIARYSLVDEISRLFKEANICTGQSPC
jgi:hypothetical protein